ncbi:hypothetical protein FA95DRAFT_1674104 [Auriscalpium vulgare]|uniref:Uncharacterized protein n=1 Tax=Auriscalpium vulgare TaxID=40419 RepID=A0ACB8SAN4_9AGAM|nr:hypothetical protein FA95DRAFT_1674104 [Auriscalpium vulgare]
MHDSIVVHGFYRYTDIWFEWHQALPNQDDGIPLKAILAYDALVDPDHPLRLEGKKGIELSIGTMQNGEARLLFSSAQAEYIRYWLHAMGYTKELIPLPYSDCLLTASTLQNYSPVTYKTGPELRQAIKAIDKNNRRLKGNTDTALASRRLVFERVRSLWAEKRGVWCAIDFEAWDRDHTLLTEFGWSLVLWENGEEVEEMGHLLVKEHQNYTSTYVQQYPKNFNFGTSEILTKNQFKTRINGLLSRIAELGPVFLVFHDKNEDIRYLQNPMVGAELNISYFLPDSCGAALQVNEPTTYVVDTSDLFAALEGDSGSQKRSLERVCRHLQIPTQFLHNAGNDARYTHLALKSMAAGDPLDMQREKRWPNHTQAPAGSAAPPTRSGVRVHFSKLEEDSDASDDDGGDGGDGPYDLRTGQLNPDWLEREREKAAAAVVGGKGIAVEVDVGEGKEKVDGQGAKVEVKSINGKGVRVASEH